MNAKYCMPIIKSDPKGIEQIIEKNKGQYDMFEIWIDPIKSSESAILNMVKSLSIKLQSKLIIVLRNKTGKITLDKSFRQDIIHAILGSKAFLDVDFEHQKEDLEFIKNNKLKVQIILSYHNYQETPNDIEKIAREMQNEKHTILKISTFCGKDSNVPKLLQLLVNLKKQNEKAVILGMGEKGTVTRVFGSLMGNEIIFAPEKTTELSAPGQLTKTQLENIFAMMNK